MWEWVQLVIVVIVKSLSPVPLFATPWTVAYQALLSMGFSRQECWSRLPFPSPGDLPNPGIELGSPALQADTLTSEPLNKGSIKDYFQSPLVIFALFGKMEIFRPVSV